ncbi:MAG TPA: hypothetical protein VHL34_08085 [Rhizomicrobium sp.]|jgi:hypothetical protein|nr:hypothetical protein [Rhizomicrobium sp.]
MSATGTRVAYASSTSFDRIRPYAVVGICAAIAGVSIAMGLTAYGVSEEGWRTSVQYAGRAAIVIFLLPFLAGPLARLFRVPGLLIDRRAYGLGFAFAYAAYLATVIAPYVLGGYRIPPTVVLFTAVGVAMLAVQVLTSNSLSIRTLGFAAWSRIHRFVMYAYWTIFTLGLLDQYVSPHRPDQFLALGLTLMIAALLIRFAAAFAEKIGFAKTIRP